MNYERLRRRRERARNVRRGLICESPTYTGPHRWSKCIFRATGYQPLNDIYVCGVHARAYLNVLPHPGGAA